MSTPQPVWKFIANLGDANPIDHGGYFVYIDETGVYAPEAELLVEPSDDEVQRDDRRKDSMERQLIRNYEKMLGRDATNAEIDAHVKAHLGFESALRWTVYRFRLEPCTYINGILSENKYHPDKPAWFATYFSYLAKSVELDVDDLAGLFCHESPIERAHAWRVVGEYHGFDNLDAYPLTLNRAEVEKRYAEELSGKPTTKGNK